MNDQHKTKEQLINELLQLRQRFAKLGDSEVERKRAEEALRQSEERYALATSAGQVGVWDWNIETNEIYLDPRLKAMLGYADNEIRNHLDDWGKFVHPDDVEQVMVKANEHLEGLTPYYDIVHRMLHKDGSIRWFLARGTAMRDTNGKAYRVLGTDTDITERMRAEDELRKYREHLEELVEERTAELSRTNEKLGQEIKERKRAEEGLRESQSRLRAQYDGIPLPTYTWQKIGEDFVLVDHNDAAKTITRGAVGNFIGKTASKMYRKDRSDILQDLWLCLNEKAVIRREMSYRFHTTGEERLLAVSYAFVPPDLVLVHTEDITERKRLEEQLLWSQKMETVGRLAAGVAHEFNNVLAVMLMNAELAKMKLPGDSELNNYLMAILRSADFGSKVVGKLLTFSKHQFIKPQVINLSNVLFEMEEIMRSLIGENIKLVTLTGDGLGWIKMDRSQLEQVLLNLVVNARDAMSDGGKITITATNATIDEDQPSENVDIAPGEYIMLSVSDTGTGMTEEVKTHLFEPFFTTKGIGKGTGLGLATCFGIIKQNGGSISAESEPGKGTTLRIYLPQIEEKTESIPGSDKPQYLPGGTETVLLVEDQPSVRDVVARTLRERGYTVLEAGSGEEGLRVAQEYGGKKIHLLLSDVVMPQMGGKKLAKRLRTHRPDIKVIFFSGYPGESTAHHRRSDSNIGFLQKPFTPVVLARKVREVLDGNAR